MILSLVLIGGAVGATIRGAVGHGMRAWLPTGTLAVNLVACFGLGLATGIDGTVGTAIRIGLFGALSTWSSLAFEIGAMLRRRDLALACSTLGVSIGGGVGLAWLGLELAP